MKIEHVRVVDLTKAQLDRLRELSFGEDGYMCDDLDLILEHENRWCYRYSQAIILGEGRSAWPIHGWALLQPIARRARYSAQFFVDPGQRNNGYGKLLLQAANTWCNRPYCYVDDDNRGFFQKYPAWHEENSEEDVAV